MKILFKRIDLRIYKKKSNKQRICFSIYCFTNVSVQVENMVMYVFLDDKM